MSDLIRILIFISILGAGFIIQFFPNDSKLNVQEMSARPTFSSDYSNIATAIAQLDTWFQKNFSGRENLISLHSIFKNLVLQSTSTGKVMYGLHGWLFFTEQNVLNDYRNNDPILPLRLDEFASTLTKRAKKLREERITHLFVVAPNSHSIYPEELPSWLTKISDKSRADQLNERANGGSNFHFIDLKQSLLQAKKWGRLYHKTDTHWNELGAFAAYQNVMLALSDILQKEKKIKEPLKILDLKDFKIVQKKIKGGDLAKMLAVEYFWHEEYIALEKIVPWTYKVASVSSDIYKTAREDIESSGGFTVLQPTDFETKNESASNQLRVLFFRDSFFTALQPYFSESFSHVILKWEVFDPKIALKHPVDVIIDETVERSLSGYELKKIQKN